VFELEGGIATCVADVNANRTPVSDAIAIAGAVAGGGNGDHADCFVDIAMCRRRTAGVKVAAAKEGVTITSDNPDLGEVREELEAEFNAEPIAIGFNPKYVVELLSQMTQWNDGDSEIVTCFTSTIEDRCGTTGAPRRSRWCPDPASGLPSCSRGHRSRPTVEATERPRRRRAPDLPRLDRHGLRAGRHPVRERTGALATLARIDLDRIGKTLQQGGGRFAASRASCAPSYPVQ
jgi:hypothetical protein